MVQLHSAHFLTVGGDPLWLRGLEATPPRLRLLDHINKVLAHQPWLTACSHIQVNEAHQWQRCWILGGPRKVALIFSLCCFQTLLGERCWSLAELVQAVVILAHCHSLCSFVFGCDTSPVDKAPLSTSPNGTPPAFWPFDAANGNTNVPQTPAAPTEHKAHLRVGRLSLLSLTFETVRVWFHECQHPLFRVEFASIPTRGNMR